MAVNVSPAPVVLWNFVGGNGFIWDFVITDDEDGDEGEGGEDDGEDDRI